MKIIRHEINEIPFEDKTVMLKYKLMGIINLKKNILLSRRPLVSLG